MVGRRLKLSRAAAGLSLRVLEDKIGNRVTAQAIGKYERNESMPSSGVLIALADALSVSVDYLVGDQDMALEAVEFRKKKITSRREESQVEAQVLHLLERYLLVEELLNLHSVEWHCPPEAPIPLCGMFPRLTVPLEAYGPLEPWYRPDPECRRTPGRPRGQSPCLRFNAY